MTKINVVTTSKACEILGCTRNYFYTNYKPLLTPIKDKLDTKRVYYESEVLELKENDAVAEKPIHKKFNVIQ